MSGRRRFPYDRVMLDQAGATGASADRVSGQGPDATDPAIPAVRQFLRGRTDVRLALVFGSRARGTATPASDIDVAVLAPASTC